MPEPDSARPVFVDPSGRRRRALRVIAVATATVTVSYLALLLLAVFGAPLPPAAQLPLPPGLGTDAAAENPESTEVDRPAELPSVDDRPPATGLPRMTTTTAASPTVAPAGQPAPTSSAPGRRSSRPSEPPGLSKAPTTPPGRH